MSGSINAEERRQAQQRQQDCLNAAIFAGCKASGTALFVSGGLCAGLLKYSEVRIDRCCCRGLQVVTSSRVSVHVSSACCSPDLACVVWQMAGRFTGASSGCRLAGAVPEQ
jgi:hypothetical protein